MIKLWRFKIYIENEWEIKMRKFMRNGIDWLYLDFCTSYEIIELRIDIAGIGIGISFTIKENI